MQPSPIERNMADSLPSHLLMQLVTYQTMYAISDLGHPGILIFGFAAYCPS